MTSRLDPSAPYVLDLQELGRRPGSMLTIHRSAPAPDTLGLDVIGVPKGGEVELDLRLESLEMGVLVSGTAKADVVGQCVRCLDPVGASIVADIQELFVDGDRSTDVEDLEDEDLPKFEGDLIDLETVLTDAVVLTLPLAPLCRDDCPGLCSECGARLADDPEHHHDVVDPRWAALTILMNDEKEEG